MANGSDKNSGLNTIRSGSSCNAAAPGAGDLQKRHFLSYPAKTNPNIWTDVSDRDGLWLSHRSLWDLINSWSPVVFRGRSQPNTALELGVRVHAGPTIQINNAWLVCWEKWPLQCLTLHISATTMLNVSCSPTRCTFNSESGYCIRDDSRFHTFRVAIWKLRKIMIYFSKP